MLFKALVEPQLTKYYTGLHAIISPSDEIIACTYLTQDNFYILQHLYF